MLDTAEVTRRTGGRSVKSIVFDEETIARRVVELGEEITNAYPDGELLVLGLLKGSFIFLSDLVRQIHRPLQVDFLVASSYGNDTVSSGRVRLLYDPETEQLSHISTCFGTHHLMFAEDADNTLWTSGGGQVVGWLNTRMFEETGDEVRSQGWTALIMDTNGNGRRDDYVEPDQPTKHCKRCDIEF